MGRPKAIKSPEELWDLFDRYLSHLKNNPIIVKDWVGGMGKEVEREKERPVTMEGFRVFGYNNDVTVKHYFDNINGSYDEFCTICTRIRDYIRCEQIEGGMAGIYNPSITQRLNGLKEQVETANIEQPLFTKNT
jgi:hypothetical protein